MFAKALDVNGAAKVYVLGRRLDKLKEVASDAVRFSVQLSRFYLLLQKAK
jgi:NADP-dependent 3-hydroxy acid dehydrogenase YdfG